MAGLLKQWGVRPLGEGGTYFEGVRIRGYKVTRNSSVTVTANGASRTFKHGDHVTFPVGPGGKQTLTFTGAEFIGYGQVADLQNRDVKGKLVIWMPNLASAPAAGRGGGRGGAAIAINTNRAAAAIGFAAVVFAYGHLLTSPLFAFITFLAGLTWGIEFEKDRALVGVMVSHALVGWLALSCFSLSGPFGTGS